MSIDGDEKLFGRKGRSSAKPVEEAVVEKADKEPLKSRDYRVVCGRDALLTVTAELDVYQFDKPQAIESAKELEGVKR